MELRLVVSIPSIALGVVAGYMTLDDAETLLDHAIDRLFAETTSRRPARSRSR